MGPHVGQAAAGELYTDNEGRRRRMDQHRWATFFPWEEMCLLENLLAAVRQDGDLAGIQPRKLRK